MVYFTANLIYESFWGRNNWQLTITYSENRTKVLHKL